jgi:hypothetical protein
MQAFGLLCALEPSSLPHAEIASTIRTAVKAQRMAMG